MQKPNPVLPNPVLPNPVLIEVTRGGGVESVHRGAAVAVSANGEVIGQWGNARAWILPRSAAKPIQALPLIETGAAARYNYTDSEMALACSSHSAEAAHIKAVEALLQRIGLSGAAFECGAHPPLNGAAAAKLNRRGEMPGRIHNNCSGKHTGFLATARHLGEDVLGYVAADHPVQMRVRQVLIEMTGASITGTDLDPGASWQGVDGCGIPVFAVPLDGLARGMARLAAPDDLPPKRAAAARRIVAAMAANPMLVAGTGRFDTMVIEATGGSVVSKSGAEGVQVAIVPERDLGIALKIDDGTKRASEGFMAALLDHLGLLNDDARDHLKQWLGGPVLNAAGDTVGHIRPASGVFGP